MMNSLCARKLIVPYNKNFRPTHNFCYTYKPVVLVPRFVVHLSVEANWPLCKKAKTTLMHVPWVQLSAFVVGWLIRLKWNLIETGDVQRAISSAYCVEWMLKGKIQKYIGKKGVQKHWRHVKSVMQVGSEKSCWLIRKHVGNNLYSRIKRYRCRLMQMLIKWKRSVKLMTCGSVQNA